MTRSALKRLDTPDNKRKVDVLTADDFSIFRAAVTDVNYLTDHYLRTPTSGTYWKRVPDDPEDTEKAQAWQQMQIAWIAQGRPEKEFIYPANDVPYVVLRDSEGYPIFWHRHGILWQDWQKLAYHAPQSDLTIIGGFGAGKTAFIAMTLLCLAITIPNFRGFAVAPQMIQAQEVYVWIMKNIAGTPYEERFLWHSRQKPYPTFTMRNSYIGESSIEIFSVEKDPQKIRTLEGDTAFLDQAEKINGVEDKSLNALIRDLGSRLRGSTRGRAHLGKLVVVANSSDTPELWERYDSAELDPVNFLSLAPTSYQNPFLSKRDIRNLERRVGGTQRDIDQFLRGHRPIGNGTEFPRHVIEQCIAHDLDALMDGMLEEQQHDSDSMNGFVREEVRGAGIVQWEMPPDHEGHRDYIVIGDPGSSNPPNRNSGVIFVWDISEFPRKPMTMRAFKWVFGNGAITPFMSAYQHYVEYYRSYGRNGFDSTGSQKALDELAFLDMGLAAEGMDMAVGGKMRSLNSLKFFMAKRMMLYPYITGITNQLSTYKLPDHGIRQDVVMALAMSADFARRYYYTEPSNPDDEEENDYVRNGMDRYARSGGDRYSRAKAGRR